MWDRGRTFYLVVFFFGALMGCAHAPRVVCSSSVPDLLASFKSKIVELEPYLLSPKRAIAAQSIEGENRTPHQGSIDKNQSTLILSEDDREDWVAWSEKRIRDGQALLMDIEDLQGGAKHALAVHALVNELVQFWGYASQGQASQMQTSLFKVIEMTTAIEKAACHPSTPIANALSVGHGAGWVKPVGQP